MSSDLLFHVVSRRKWPKLNKGGQYKPEGFDSETGITLVAPKNINQYLNQQFEGRKNLLILVIDKARLTSSLSTDKEFGVVKLKAPLQLEAILDKIRIDCNEEKKFDLQVESFV